MDIKEIKCTGDITESHWYYTSKALALEGIISELSPNVVLDIGSGSAFFSKRLLSKTNAKEAWCVDTSYDVESDDCIGDKKIHKRMAIDHCNADIVLLMDVLEHVDDDNAFLQDIISKVDIGTHFFISVPAFQWLWSDHDIYLGHKRRYTISQLTDLIRTNGLQISYYGYFFAAVFPIAAILRLASKFFKSESKKSQMRAHSPFVNKLLLYMCKSELLFYKNNRLFGLSVLCLAKKS